MQYRQKIRKVVDACDSLRRVKLLSDLDDKQIISIAEAVEIQRYNEGDIIIQKGDTEGRDFYMIQEGLVEVRDITGAPKDLIVILQPGDSFGETALLTKEPRNATVAACEDGVIG